jgi:DNA-directed RNA polymerase subunit beta
LRPGNPPQLEKAKTLFHEKFYDVNRYRLGRVGRFRINRKLQLGVSEEEMTLRPEDLIASIATCCCWPRGRGGGDRRHRPPGQPPPAHDRRIGQRRAAQGLPQAAPHGAGADEPQGRGRHDPRSLINPKSISAAIEYFFGRGELSQVVDQTNPLSQLTHERRLSALGPGGLNRKRAGFEVRDVHISHYGRICPIETPEGTNIGLISSLAIYAGVDDYGFLVTPYRKVKKGKLTDEIVWLRADEEAEAYVAPADTVKEGKLQATDPT